MNYKKELNLRLYDKVQHELNSFREEVLTKPPQEIYEKAYQITIKTDFAECFYNCDFSVKTVKEMLKSPDLLEEIYQEWLSNDFSYMQELRDTIDDFEKKLAPIERKAWDKER